MAGAGAGRAEISGRALGCSSVLGTLGKVSPLSGPRSAVWTSVGEEKQGAARCSLPWAAIPV